MLLGVGILVGSIGIKALATGLTRFGLVTARTTARAARTAVIRNRVRRRRAMKGIIGVQARIRAEHSLAVNLLNDVRSIGRSIPVIFQQEARNSAGEFVVKLPRTIAHGALGDRLLSRFQGGSRDPVSILRRKLDKRTPVRTGRLKRGNRVRRTGPNSIQLINNTPYASITNKRTRWADNSIRATRRSHSHAGRDSRSQGTSGNKSLRITRQLGRV